VVYKQMHKKLARCDIGVLSCDLVAESAQVVYMPLTHPNLLLERVVGRVKFLENGLLRSENMSEM
jgi:hypothetical protein